MLLLNYPEIQNLTTPAVNSPMILAAKSGLTTVLQMFEEHAKRTQPETVDGLNVAFFELMSFPISSGGPYILDAAWMYCIKCLQAVGNYSEVSDLDEKKVEDAIDLFGYLRERGAISGIQKEQQQGFILR